MENIQDKQASLNTNSRTFQAQFSQIQGPNMA